MVDLKEKVANNILEAQDMGSAMKVALEATCVTKIFMHALKYPAQTVCGIIIGQQSSKQGRQCLFMDIVPLFHTHIVSPMMKLGIEVVESYCEERCSLNSKVEIVGFYFIDSTLDLQHKPEMSLQGKQIVDKIASAYPELIVCLLNSNFLTHTTGSSFCFFSKTHSWFQLPDSSIESDTDFQDALKLAANLLVSDDIFDLDDHLASAAADPLNPNLKSLIQIGAAAAAKQAATLDVNL